MYDQKDTMRDECRAAHSGLHTQTVDRLADHNNKRHLARQTMNGVLVIYAPWRWAGLVRCSVSPLKHYTTIAYI